MWVLFFPFKGEIEKIVRTASFLWEDLAIMSWYVGFPSDCRYYWDPSLVIGQMLNSGGLCWGNIIQEGHESEVYGEQWAG